MREVLAQQHALLSLDEFAAANKLFVFTEYKLRIVLV